MLDTTSPASTSVKLDWVTKASVTVACFPDVPIVGSQRGARASALRPPAFVLQSTPIGKAIDSVSWVPRYHSISWHSKRSGRFIAQNVRVSTALRPPNFVLLRETDRLLLRVSYGFLKRVSECCNAFRSVFQTVILLFEECFTVS